MKYIKDNLVSIIVIVLLLVILLQRCGGDVISHDVKIIRDTTWIHHDSTINSKPQVIKTEPYAVPIDRWNTEYLPDTSSMSMLIKQYEALVRELLAKNISVDSIKIDSIGHIYITDTVSKNVIIGRSSHYDLKYPMITNTVIIPEPKKNQWYIGGALQGERNELIDQINTGLLLKTKKDQIYGGYIGISTSGQFQFGVQSYWKIKLKKDDKNK